MTPELRKVLERARQARAIQATTGTPTRPLAHAPGARVFDTVSGQYGEVLSAGTENLVVPDARRVDG